MIFYTRSRDIAPALLIYALYTLLSTLQKLELVNEIYHICDINFVMLSQSTFGDTMWST